MSSDHENVALVRRSYDLVARGDFGGLLEQYGDEIVWHYYNLESPLHGDHVGREGVIRFLAGLMEGTGGTFHIEPVSVTPAGNELVLQHVYITMEFDGRHIEKDGAIVSRIVDGLVREIWDMPSVHAVQDITSQPTA